MSRAEGFMDLSYDFSDPESQRTTGSSDYWPEVMRSRIRVKRKSSVKNAHKEERLLRVKERTLLSENACHPQAA